MARASMLQRSGKNGAESSACGGDEVARSLELLDRVLSEFEDQPAAAPVLPPAVSVNPTPDHGHQSEDDGYMSMNGRRAKFALGFRPTVEQEEGVASPPPPPEEAERIISHLLPMVSPSNSSRRTPVKGRAPPPPPPIQTHLTEEDELCSLISINGVLSTTQTTFPKTRHQRPYGWNKDPYENGHYEEGPQEPQSARFSSLQNNKQQRTYTPPNWLPPRHDNRPDRRTTEKLLTKKSPSLDNPLTLTFIGFPNEFSTSKPYNEHPVTIYPGPNIQYKQGQSPYSIPKFNSKNVHTALDNSRKSRKDDRADGEILSPNHKIPPRTLAGSMEKHRDVRRGSIEDINYENNEREEEHFSDDSLEDKPIPSIPHSQSTPSKRNSIAWEVPLDDEAVLTPGSTKVVSNRRKTSRDNSHPRNYSISKGKDEKRDQTGQNYDYWPPPPKNYSLENDRSSPLTDNDSDNQYQPHEKKDLGTYVIRRGKNRKEIPVFNKNVQNNENDSESGNLKPRFGKTRSEDVESDVRQIIPGFIKTRSQDVLNGSPRSPVVSKHISPDSLSPRAVGLLNTPKSRHSIDLNMSRVKQDLTTPKSRYSVDLCNSNPRLMKNLNSPKSRLSLDLNLPNDLQNASERYNCSPRNTRSLKVNGIDSYKQKEYINKLSPQNRFSDFKKYSSTFDNIKSLIKEGVVEDCPPAEIEETVAEINTTTPVRVVSLSSLADDEQPARSALITTVEEEDDHERDDSSPLRKIENNISAILNRARRAPYSPKDWNIHKDEYDNEVSDEHTIEGEIFYGTRDSYSKRDVQKSASHGEIPSQRSVERRDRSFGRKANGVQKSTSAKDVQSSLNRQPSSSDSAVSSVGDFPVNVHIVEHSFRPHNSSPGIDLGPLPKTPESPSFPPLPPSPVPEVDDEYSEILVANEKISSVKHVNTATPELRHRVSESPMVASTRESNSLKTRSMETSYKQNKRNSNFRSGSTDRRTLPTEIGSIGGNTKRRTLGRGARTLQTSASLPETPIFTRGVDVARTPQRTQPPSRTSTTLSALHSGGGSSTLGGYTRGSSVEHVMTGAELLRMAGGPGRGWYPRQRQRPASIEHLDRLGTTGKSVSDHHVAWDGTGTRKPLTLPPNITPKFFQRSPREALRRVTSLLIRKGNAKEKETRQKETTSPAARSANGDDLPGQKPKKGFFRSLWKRSRQYSLEHP